MKNSLLEAPTEELRKVGEIIGGIRVAMVNNRPMQVQEVEGQGNLWFFTSSDGGLVNEVMEDPLVSLSFADTHSHKYLVARGHASQVMDRSKMEELWQPSLNTWFPDGLESPDICLLRIGLLDAEYWDSPSSPVIKIAGFFKSLIGENAYTPGEHEKVHMSH